MTDEIWGNNDSYAPISRHTIPVGSAGPVDVSLPWPVLALARSIATVDGGIDRFNQDCVIPDAEARTPYFKRILDETIKVIEVLRAHGMTLTRDPGLDVHPTLLPTPGTNPAPTAGAAAVPVKLPAPTLAELPPIPPSISKRDKPHIMVKTEGGPVKIGDPDDPFSFGGVVISETMVPASRPKKTEVDPDETMSDAYEDDDEDEEEEATPVEADAGEIDLEELKDVLGKLKDAMRR